MIVWLFRVSAAVMLCRWVTLDLCSKDRGRLEQSTMARGKLGLEKGVWWSGSLERVKGVSRDLIGKKDATIKKTMSTVTRYQR